jgi:hypothetical protein
MRKLSHNKKRTCGLVYEFLTREVTEAAVARDAARAATALSIMSGHLSEGSPLFPELSLHRQAIATRGVSPSLAQRIVDELKAAGIRNHSRRNLIESAKSELIHEMNRRIGRDIFDRYRIPDYTAHASIGILLSRGLSGQLDEGIELARLEEHLVSYMTTEATDRPRYDREATLYAYQTALSLFEKEIGRELSAPQSELLGEYVRVSLGGNPAPFERTFDRQRRSLREVLRSRRSDEVFSSDPDMSIRLDEAIAGLDSLPAKPDDESVERLMLYHNLRREIES